MFISGDTAEKFISGVVDTGEQFFGGVVDTGDKFQAYWFFSERYQRHRGNINCSRVSTTIQLLTGAEYDGNVTLRYCHMTYKCLYRVHPNCD